MPILAQREGRENMANLNWSKNINMFFTIQIKRANFGDIAILFTTHLKIVRKLVSVDLILKELHIKLF